MNAGSDTTARWNGMTVARPSTWNSSSARRERASASSRVAPVTISLASIESNWPPITEPDSTPESSRTPGPGRRLELGDRAGRGQEAAAGVLAVDPELEGVPARRRVLGDVERLAVGDPELLQHQVDARGLLGDRVLDLQAGVDLEEGDQAVLADQVLDRAGAVVAGLLADPLGRLVDLLALRVGQERRGRLFDQLLEAALQRAVAGAGDDDVAVLVGDHLRLDVARLVQVALDEALAAAERRRRPRGWPSRTARGSPRWCGRPSCRGRRRRTRP